MRRLPAAAVFFFLVTTAPARRAGDLCGTTAETPAERLFLHRQALRRGVRAAATLAADRDIGNIAVIDDSAGVVARQNEFNLDLHTLRFTPAGTGYRYAVLDGGYDEAAASAGDPLAALDDDDARLIPLPFAFPFFGA